MKAERLSPMSLPASEPRRTLGLSLGAGQAWRILSALPAGAQIPGVDYLVFRDGIGEIVGEDHYALLVAAFAAPRLAGIGLVPEVDLYRADPYLIARALTSLDILSGGRAGLLALGGPQGEPRIGYASTASDAGFVAEFFEVLGKLWNSWDEGALARRWDENLYLDRDRLHEANHRGAHFAARGPLPTPRAVQARPVVFATDHPSHAGIAATAAGVVSARRPPQGRWIRPVDAEGLAAARADPDGCLVEVPAEIITVETFETFVAGLPTSGASHV
ncbi:MAG: LLM class flavin-dependent oxidoreductase [Inquilinus sp.]|uniref:LLM class flavin-dependent oxidoreductase n=1 Tax=Inquilinus sp. TaxID=1932117 RepID=UPI003F385360